MNECVRASGAVARAAVGQAGEADVVLNEPGVGRRRGGKQIVAFRKAAESVRLRSQPSVTARQERNQVLGMEERGRRQPSLRGCSE